MKTDDISKYLIKVCQNVINTAILSFGTEFENTISERN